jgi:hypothetical protein
MKKIEELFEELPVELQHRLMFLVDTNIWLVCDWF